MSSIPVSRDHVTYDSEEEDGDETAAPPVAKTPSVEERLREKLRPSSSMTSSPLVNAFFVFPSEGNLLRSAASVDPLPGRFRFAGFCLLVYLATRFYLGRTALLDVLHRGLALLHRGLALPGRAIGFLLWTFVSPAHHLSVLVGFCVVITLAAVAFIAWLYFTD